MTTTTFQALAVRPAAPALEDHFAFFAAWERAAHLVGVEAFPRLAEHPSNWASLQLGPMQAVLKTLHGLDLPHRALLLTMINLVRPDWARWINSEIGLDYSHLTANRMGTEVFTALLDLLATHPATH